MWLKITTGVRPPARAAGGVLPSKWDERPLPAAARKPGQALDKQGILAALMRKIAKWWLPDALVFLDAIPHSAAGKVQKLVRRQRATGDRLSK